MKRLLLVILTIVVLVFVGCSRDESFLNRSKIIGRWETSNYWVMSNGVFDGQIHIGDITEFRWNQTGESQSGYKFAWFVKNNHLYIQWNDQSADCEIRELSDTRLVLRAEESASNWVEIDLRRVNY